MRTLVELDRKWNKPTLLQSTAKELLSFRIEQKRNWVAAAVSEERVNDSGRKQDFFSRPPPSSSLPG